MEAIEKRREIIRDYRTRLRPKPDEPAITTGFIVNPQIYLDIRQYFLDSEKSLGGWQSLESDLLWIIGFQSLLGAGPAALAQILIGGANKYLTPGYVPSEALTFDDGARFHEKDIKDILVGVGASIVVSYWGEKLAARDAVGSHLWGGQASEDVYKTFVEQQHQYSGLTQLPARTLTTTRTTR